MDHFYKYPKPRRFPVPWACKSKRWLTRTEVKVLTSSPVIVQEKMDGRLSYLQLDDYLLFYEDLRVTHSIPYTIPYPNMLFDALYLPTMTMLSYDQLQELWNDIRYELPVQFFLPRVIARGKFTLSQLIRMAIKADSPFTEDGRKEGIVVKLDAPQPYANFLAGKIVNKEFEDGIRESGHYLRRGKVVTNKITSKIL